MCRFNHKDTKEAQRTQRNYMHYYLTGTILLSMLAFSCRESVLSPPLEDKTYQYQYFPLTIGRYIDYAVDSIVYDFGPNGSIVRDSVRRYARERIADTLRDDSGALLYTIERYERGSIADPWRLKRIWTAARTADQAVRTEENQRFLKLIFPLELRRTWNGNMWIDPGQEIQVAGERIRPFANWRYRVDSLDIPGQIGTFAFDSLLVVTEADDVNAIERRFSRVHYALHIGPVRREQWILDSQYCNQNPSPADCLTKPWTEKAEKGYIVRQTAIEFN